MFPTVLLKHSAPAVVLLLSGCLYTARPVFTEANSLTPAQSAEWAEFAAVYEAYAGEKAAPSDMDDPEPRLVEFDDFLVLESHEPGDDAALHVAMGHAGGRPFLCLVEPDEATERRAAAAGIAVVARITGLGRLVPPEEGGTGYPVFDGPDEALRAFVLDEFREQELPCRFPPRDG